MIHPIRVPMARMTFGIRSAMILMLLFLAGCQMGADRKEAMFWSSVTQSNKAADYAGYLARYPGGAHTAQAKSTLASMGGQPSKVVGEKLIAGLQGKWTYRMKWYSDTFGYCVLIDPRPSSVTDDVFRFDWYHSRLAGPIEVKIDKYGGVHYASSLYDVALKLTGKFTSPNTGVFDFYVYGIENLSCGADVIATRN